MSWGRSVLPRSKTMAPACRSSPAMRVFAPFLTVLRRRILLSTSSASSSSTMVSAPAGSTAPVKMRIAAPRGTTPSHSFPADARPSAKARSDRTSESCANAYPSTAAFGVLGFDLFARTGSARIRPAASAMETFFFRDCRFQRIAQPIECLAHRSPVNSRRQSKAAIGHHRLSQNAVRPIRRCGSRMRAPQAHPNSLSVGAVKANFQFPACPCLPSAGNAFRLEVTA